MLISGPDRVRMERAHVHAWPALQTADIEGWLWRSSGGGSQRANSVSTIDFAGNDPDAAIARVEARYGALGQPARFQTFDETRPAGLADRLRDRGYRASEATITMFKRTESADGGLEVELRDSAWPDWRDAYLGEISENRRAVNALILDRIPSPCAFFGCRRGGAIVATGLGVLGYGCVVVECVATWSDARRTGAARAVLAALAQWAAAQSADWIGLQVTDGNAAAIALYQRLGFVAGATNCFWVSGMA